MSGVLIRRGHREAQRDGHVRMRQKLESIQSNPGNSWSHENLEKARKDPSVELLRKHGPWDTMFQISSLQNHERINLCHSNHLVCNLFLSFFYFSSVKTAKEMIYYTRVTFSHK